jgi:hypothetical protein
MSGWLIGVMVEVAGEATPVRFYFAIGFEDRAKAEWTAIDGAAGLGNVAYSPVNGLEPVQALSPLTPAKMKRLGLMPGEVRALGRVLPRKWL